MSNPTKKWFHLTSSLAVVLAVIILLALASNLLPVRQVTCQLTSLANCPEDVESELRSLHGSHLLFSNLTQEAQSLTSVIQRYKVQAITKTLLGEVNLMLQPIDPLYLAKLSTDQYLVTELGGLIPLTDTTRQYISNYCTIILSSNENPGLGPFEQNEMLSNQQIQSDLHSQVKLFLTALEVRQLQCRELSLIDQYTWVLSLPSIDRVVIDPTELETNLDRLVLLVDSSILSEELHANSYLDVRFSLPVLRKSL